MSSTHPPFGIKPSGDFQFDAANKDWGHLSSLVLMTTCFNPTPNDRNVEFDPKRNLVPDRNVSRP